VAFSFLNTKWERWGKEVGWSWETARNGARDWWEAEKVGGVMGWEGTQEGKSFGKYSLVKAGEKRGKGNQTKTGHASTWQSRKSSTRNGSD